MIIVYKLVVNRVNCLPLFFFRVHVKLYILKFIYVLVIEAANGMTAMSRELFNYLLDAHVDFSILFAGIFKSSAACNKCRKREQNKVQTSSFILCQTFSWINEEKVWT